MIRKLFIISFCLIFSDVQIGDVVTIGECRPLSKTVRFNVLKVAKAAGSKKQFQKF
jgi:small subunit ribosomal protein S11e